MKWNSNPKRDYEFFFFMTHQKIIQKKFPPTKPQELSIHYYSFTRDPEEASKLDIFSSSTIT